jgi:hypothetical protein
MDSVEEVRNEPQGCEDFALRYSGSRENYLRAKRSKSIIWRSISSRAESEAERTP